MVFGKWHKHAFLHILIIYIIFLFQPASINLIANVLLKSMNVCLLHYKPAPPCFITCLQATATGFVISTHLNDREAIKCAQKSHSRSIYCIINYPNLLNISAGIPVAC